VTARLEGSWPSSIPAATRGGPVKPARGGELNRDLWIRTPPGDLSGFVV